MADHETAGESFERAQEPVGERRVARARSAAWHVVREPVVVILIVAGLVDTFTELTWAHGALLMSAGVLLAWDLAFGKERHGIAVETAPWNLRITPKWALVGVAYAVVAGSFARYSWPATLATLLPGVGALVVAWHGPLAGRKIPPKISREGALAWLTFFLTLALFELANLLMQPSLTADSYAHPTFSVLMDPVLANSVGRSVSMMIWLAFGWFLLER
jgi:hypothetical protein